MRTVFLALLHVLLLGLLMPQAPFGRATAEEEAEAPLGVRVNRAITSGVAWMGSTQRADGTFPLKPPPPGDLNLGLDVSAEWAGGPWDKGANALCVYTLAACDVPQDDPLLVKGFARLRTLWEERRITSGISLGRGDGISTYFVSLCLLALDAANNPTAGPLTTGTKARKKRRTPLSKADLRWARELVAWLHSAQDPGAGKSGAASHDILTICDQCSSVAAT